MGQLALVDLIDLGQVQGLLDAQALITGMPMAILDPGGRVLVASGPGTSEAPVVAEGEGGLRQVSLSIEVEGRQAATLLLGPFRLEESRAPVRGKGPDPSGGALPVFSLERADLLAGYARGLVQLLVTLGLNNQRLRLETEERIQAEYALRKIKDDLDVRVKERTTELNRSNENLRAEIRERLRSDLSLRKSEERFRALVENIGEGVAYVDPGEKFIFANPAAERIFGVGRDGLMGRNLMEFAEAPSSAIIREQTRRRLAGERSTYELRIRDAEGVLRDLLVTATPHFAPGGAVLGIQGIFRDITERKRTEEALLRLSTAIGQASDSIIVSDTEGVILYANPSTSLILGLPEETLVGRNIRRLDSHREDPGFYRRVHEGLLRGEGWHGRLRSQREDGSVIETDTTISPVLDGAGGLLYVVTTSRDVSRESELEAQLRHSHRMEAIGVLAGGIAHDFNNLLTPIVGFSELALRRPDLDPKLREYLAEIFGAGRRAAELVSQILTFSRQGEQPKVPILLHPVVKECIKLLRAALPSTITIHPAIEESGTLVQADPTQIHQVLMILSTNAFHAMAEGGGVLGVGLDTVHQEEEAGLVSGDYLRLRVSDTGTGMDAGTLTQIFLPFFTTKKVGEGTGLGLSIAHGIVGGMGGRIKVESAPGLGSTFTVLLPAFAPPVPAGPDLVSPASPGRERVLVVDDDPSVGGMLRDALTMFGYRVTTTDSSLCALRMFLDMPGAFDLVVTDMTMPDLTGLVLGGRIRELRPDIPMILISGYTESLGDEAIQEKGFGALLQKPISIGLLGRTARSLLEGVPSRSGPVQATMMHSGVADGPNSSGG